MISTQLGRSLLDSPLPPADAQDARPDEAGGYGELMADIDRVLREHEGRDRAREAS